MIIPAADPLLPGYFFKDMNEGTLIQACIQLNRPAQFELVRLFGPRLLTVCRRFVPVGLDPKDSLQDAFIQIFSQLHRFDADRGELWPWLKKITIYTALKKHRLTGKWHLNGVELTDQNELLAADENALQHLDTEQILTLIASLPSGQREVFQLVALDGYSHEECAELLGMAAGTSRAYLTRARMTLKERYLNIQTLAL